MLNTYNALNRYQAHDLNISMRTSSGDVIKMDFANHNSASYSHQQDANGSKTSMSFSSMQSFNFSIKDNGIDAQDKKEIDAFMKIAKPFVDNFLKELEDVAPKSPVSKLARQIATIFDPSRDRDADAKNQIKTNIVEMFDNSIKKLELPEKQTTQEMIEKIFKDTQILLEKTLRAFEYYGSDIYA